MKKPDPIEQRIDRLTELRAEPNLTAVAAELSKALNDRSNLVVAKAAKIGGELRLLEVVPGLVAAFERLMANPAKLDRRCVATFEIATALHALDYMDPDVYRRGIRHVQMEGSFGPPVDVAAKLRAQCALGLARTTHPEALTAVTELLADKEPHARIGAIRALATNGGEAGALLLRFKAMTGDDDAEVLAECFLGLLSADFDRSLAFVSRFMDGDSPEVSESATLAIGSQRRVEAFAVLREKWDRSVYSEMRKTLLTAMAMVRIDEATEFLIDLLDSAATPTAVEVVRVLAAYHREDRVRERVMKVVEERGNPELRAALREWW
jgi:HEAT repeat protein